MSNRDVIGKWWRTHIGARESSSARALAARLNRGEGVDILAERAVYDLAVSLRLLSEPARVVQLVQVIAAVREDRGGAIARRMGQGEKPALSPLRFQRLLRADGPELATLIRRALPMVDRACDVGALGADVLHWDDATRARWAFAYFGAEPPATLTPLPQETDL